MLSNFGPFACTLESIARNYLGSVAVRAISSGDTGLIAVLRALEIEGGAEVIMPSFTFNSTANACLWNGLTPHFVDIDPRTFCLDPGRVVEALSHRTGAILATHVFGCPAEVDALEEIADDAGIPLVFDAAHGYGSDVRGKKVGNFGTAEVFSLSGTKLVTASEGGLVATSDQALDERVSYIRQYGFKGDYRSRFLGLNGKVSELNAALGCLTLPTVDDAVERRNAMVGLYRRLLRREPQFRFQEIPAGCRSAFKDFAVLLPGCRDGVARGLEEMGIQTKMYFRPLHESAFFAPFPRDDLSVTARTSRQILCLPLWNEIEPETISHVCEALLASLDQVASPPRAGGPAAGTTRP